MADLSLTAWACPHCKAVWHSGRQYCIDCGYGMAPAHDPGRVAGERIEARHREETVVVPREQLVPATAHGMPQPRPPYEDILALGGQPPPTGETGAGEQMRVLSMTPEQAQAFMKMVETAPPEPIQQVQRHDVQLEEALRRSLAVESALQAELAPLRERVGQLESQLQAQRVELVAGVQRLLQPLVTFIHEMGHAVSVSQVVGVAVKLLQEQALELGHWREQGRKQRVAVDQHGVRVHQGLELVEQLVREVAALRERLDGMAGADAVSSVRVEPQGGSDYGTWVTTDRSAYELEQALLREQTQRGGGMAYGG